MISVNIEQTVVLVRVAADAGSDGLTAQEVGFAGDGIAQVLQTDVADNERANGRTYLILKLDAGCGGGGRATGPRFPSGGTRILSTVNFQWLIR
jgi:hypothetical protein